jgi:outer membrane protein assembly factor BamB
VLLAVIGRNDGPELIRLNPEKGQLLWTISPRVLANGFDVESLCIGDTSFYYMQAGQLHARSLNDGSVQWTLPLAETRGRWRIRYTKEALAVYATGGGAVDFIDPWEGQRLQRLTFPDMPSRMELYRTAGALIVATGAKIYGFRSLDRE